MINPIYSDKFFVAPADTGAHHPSGLALGTMTDFDHVFVQHLQIYHYSMSAAFASWYEHVPNKACSGNSYCYFEIEWSGSSWLPEALLYIIAKATGKDGTFGTEEGKALLEDMPFVSDVDSDAISDANNDDPNEQGADLVRLGQHQVLQALPEHFTLAKYGVVVASGPGEAQTGDQLMWNHIVV